MKDIHTPTINALGTINVESLTLGHQMLLGVWHYRPTYSYLIRLRQSRQGMVAESTSERNVPAELTEHMFAMQASGASGLEALVEAFEWLEEQTKPRTS